VTTVSAFSLCKGLEPAKLLLAAGLSSLPLKNQNFLIKCNFVSLESSKNQPKIKRKRKNAAR